MSDGEIRIFVPGIPQPGGSKRGFFNRKLGRVIITEDNKRSKPWRASAEQAAYEVVKAVVDGPLKVRFDFVFNRPKGHYGSGKNSTTVKAGAPPYPNVKPDTTKLVRSLEDALTGIVWKDDAQIVTQVATKRYGDQAGALVRIRPENGIG